MAVRSLDDERALLATNAEEHGAVPAIIPVEDIVVSGLFADSYGL